MHWVYIIRSESTEKFYTGYTNDIERRLLEHNIGHTKSTRNNGPWHLVYCEKLETRLDASRRERQIKSYKSGAAFKKLIEN